MLKKAKKDQRILKNQKNIRLPFTKFCSLKVTKIEMHRFKKRNFSIVQLKPLNSEVFIKQKKIKKIAKCHIQKNSFIWEHILNPLWVSCHMTKKIKRYDDYKNLTQVTKNLQNYEKKAKNLIKNQPTKQTTRTYHLSKSSKPSQIYLFR